MSRGKVARAYLPKDFREVYHPLSELASCTAFITGFEAASVADLCLDLSVMSLSSRLCQQNEHAHE